MANADQAPKQAEPDTGAVVDGGNGALPPQSEEGAFSAEEQQQFEQMEQADGAVGDGGTQDVAASDAPAGQAGAAQGAPKPGQDPDAGADDDADDGADDAPAVAGQEGQQSPKRVAYSKYRRAETEGKKTKAELAEERKTSAALREQVTRFDERMNLLTEALTPKQQQQQQQDPRPDPENIFEYVPWLERQVGRLQQGFDQMQRGQQANNEISAVGKAYLADVEVFAQQEPDFWPAYEFLKASRAVEMAQYFFQKDLTDPETPPLSPQEWSQINDAFSNEEQGLAETAIRAGRSPGKSVYALARARGWRKQDAAGQQPGQQPAAGAAPQQQNGAAQRPAAGPNVTDEIARVRQGQEAARSLSSGGGSPGGTGLPTPQQLATMPQDEFNALMDRLSPEQQDRMMGA